MSTTTAFAYALAAILIACVVFALGAYFGYARNRDLCARLFANLTQALDALDELGEMYDAGVARRFAPAFADLGDDALAVVADEGSTT